MEDVYHNQVQCSIFKEHPKWCNSKWEESCTSAKPPSRALLLEGAETEGKLYRRLCTLASVAAFSHSSVLPKWRWCREHGLQNSRWGWLGPHGNQIPHWEVNRFGTFVISTLQKLENNLFYCIVLKELFWDIFAGRSFPFYMSVIKTCFV